MLEAKAGLPTIVFRELEKHATKYTQNCYNPNSKDIRRVDLFSGKISLHNHQQVE